MGDPAAAAFSGNVSGQVSAKEERLALMQLTITHHLNLNFTEQMKTMTGRVRNLAHAATVRA